MRITAARGIVSLTLVAVIVSILVVYHNWRSFLHTPLQIDQAVEYTLKPGTGFRQFVKDLHDIGVIHQPNYFTVLAYLRGQINKLQAGEYRFTPNLTPGELLDEVVEGKVIQYKFSIIEGWTFQQVMAAINANPYMKHELQDLTQEQIMFQLGSTQKTAEGNFYPDTYYFTRNKTDVELLKRAYQKMQQDLTSIWQNRSSLLPYTDPQQALIVASLIEKESAIPSERPLIAGIILNRLEKHMPLQIDASIIFGLGDRYSGKLTKENMKFKTPYNTYVHRGLPPTPIAMPSKQAIEAALHPMLTNYLYYVARGDGTHQFSETLKEQNEAVNKYQRRLTVQAPTNVTPN
ncbi:MAG: endolytic transglycosylase MltG [Proteobacteria bacterium]|nr:endolytic transglycosylase MltG [Pseudomonadota bacterium]